MQMVKKWKSMQDGRVRDLHAEMNGTVVLMGEMFELPDGIETEAPKQSGAPHHDCNCRCTCLYPLMDDEEFFKATGKHFKNTGEKMATESGTTNDWSETEPRTVSREEQRELRDYAEQKGVTIANIKDFDGEPELLKSEIDTIAKINAQLPVKQKVSVSVSNSMPDDDFASTVGGHITFNTKALRNRAATEKNIRNGGMFASETVEDIALHEFGHIWASQNGNIGLEIAQKAYYNIHRKNLAEDDMLEFLFAEVSPYAISYEKTKRDSKVFNARRYKEIIPEILAKNNAKSDAFTKEFVSLLKGRR